MYIMRDDLEEIIGTSNRAIEKSKILSLMSDEDLIQVLLDGYDLASLISLIVNYQEQEVGLTSKVILYIYSELIDQEIEKITKGR